MPSPVHLHRRAFLCCAACAAAARLWPSAAAAATPASEPLKLEEVEAGVFVYRAPYALMTPDNLGAIANMGLVVGEEGAAVIDTGNSLAAGTKIREAVRAVTDRPVRYVINTHMHPDHVLGNAAFRGAGVRFAAHHKMARALSMRAETYMAQVERLLGPLGAGTQLVLPDMPVETAAEIDLGGRRLRLESWPTAHTDNDLTVLDERTGTWFLGDLLFVGHVPALDGSINGWLERLDSLGARKVGRAVPGHGPAAVDWPAAMAAERSYLEALRADVRRLIAQGSPMSDAPRAASADATGWALFDEFNARNAIAAYHELEWE